MIKGNGSILVLALVIAVGTIVFVQQNATNQTMTSNYTAQAKPDTEKFCADTTNDDGTTSECTSTYKSKGECKKTGSELHGPDFAGCRKNN